MKTTTFISKELRQLIALCVSTYYNLYGEMPSIQELSRELGNQFSSLLAEKDFDASVLIPA